MILLSAVVGEDFKEEIEKYEWTHNIKPYIGGHKLHLITNLEGFEEYEIVPYHSHIWNYVDKILYSFILSQKYDEDVLWIDYNKIHKHYYYINLPKPNEFLIDDIWWMKESEDQFRTESNTLRFCDLISKGWTCWEPVQEYINRFHLKNDFTIPMEEVFYIPRGLPNNKIIRTIEILKTVVSYSSYLSNFPYRTINGDIGIGNGEGVILPILSQQHGFNLELCNIPTPTPFPSPTPFPTPFPTPTPDPTKTLI